VTLELAMISPHTPRICHKDKVADFQKQMVEAMNRTVDIIEQINPDVVVLVSCHWAASLEETTNWGKVIGEVIQASPLRIVFVVSGALAHNVGRGPEKWPNRTEQTLDREFCNYLVSGDRAAALDMLPTYARAAGVESGGRHIAMLLGVLQHEFTGELHGYGPSSGSGNPVLTLQYAV
jgi:3,4-dihydroxyphenylacetate 2,3-dioxygenase